MNIKNHPSILNSKPIVIASGCVPHRIVLRVDESSYHKYVTHMENLKIEGEDFVHDSFYWGHYHETLAAAEEDFRNR